MRRGEVVFFLNHADRFENWKSIVVSVRGQRITQEEIGRTRTTTKIRQEEEEEEVEEEETREGKRDKDTSVTSIAPSRLSTSI